ncbi:MAG: sigma-54 dependent transcriptional regulator, partial [Desulfocapsaceae bacterium]|nr:sigma-54 dependent transcriptional regulator [Desulfocapsaceae bacterium]
MDGTKEGPAVLFIDSDEQFLASLTESVVGMNIVPDSARTLKVGLDMAASGNYEIILMRDQLSDGPASYAVADFQAGPDAPEVILYTTLGDSTQAEHALKSGVWDFIIDPSPIDILPDILQRALRYRLNKRDDLREKQQSVRRQLNHFGIVGRSKTLQNCIDLSIRIAQSDANVLLFGESGTGKELFASAIHNFSPRSKNDLTIVDCAALPPSLVESILFGHTRGSFTGADKAQAGLIQQSDRGTLFLDEIGEMPLAIQKKLLRVIQERTYLPVGASVERKSDFRLVAATNRDLEAMVEEGRFREDLLFRLKTFYLELPSLRERQADITELAYYCRDKFCRAHKLKKKTFSSEYLLILTQYEWPGNVRELFQAVERSIADAQESTTLYPKHLPPGVRIEVTRKKLKRNRRPDATLQEAARLSAEEDELPTLREARDKMIEVQERSYLERLLAITGGDIKEACRIAGLSRSRLYDLLKKYNLIKNKTTPSTH